MCCLLEEEGKIKTLQIVWSKALGDVFRIFPCSGQVLSFVRDDGDSVGERSEKWKEKNIQHTFNIYLLDFQTRFCNQYSFLFLFVVFI